MRGLMVNRSWVAIFAVLALLVLGGQVLYSLPGLSPAAVVAQEEGAAVDPAAEPAAGETPAEAAPVQKNFLVWFAGALGWRYCIAFLIISFSFVAVLVMNLLSARRDAVCPRHLADAFEAHLNEKRFQEAFDLAKADESMLGQMLAAGMSKLQQGYDKAMEAMGQVGEEENMKIEHRMSYIGLVGSISPMVGLLGTVDGMVASFMVIAAATTTPKPSVLAEGVSTALITTLVGLVLAIPAVISLALLKNRFAKLVMEVGITAGNLMGRFEGMAAKK
ncbi:MAG: MotA/TolQ/ExbB proton channel family protein [Planctomycetales bacterium]|nr:MotA/TolQ/ExbB proton channel family protein [Planctomycetales bacterium]